MLIKKKRKDRLLGASLVAQWLRICMPMQGKIPHAAEQLSPRAATTEPVL